MFSFFSLKTEKQSGISIYLRYFYGPPHSHSHFFFLLPPHFFAILG